MCIFLANFVSQKYTSSSRPPFSQAILLTIDSDQNRFKIVNFKEMSNSRLPGCAQVISNFETKFADNFKDDSHILTQRHVSCKLTIYLIESIIMILTRRSLDKECIDPKGRVSDHESIGKPRTR